MPPATDFVHDEEIVDAVLTQLAGNLPASWTSDDSPVFRLHRIQFGDLRDWRATTGQGWRRICPAVLVRLDRSERAPQYGGLGGKEGQIVPLRLLHIRTRDQCRDLTDPAIIISPARARAQYAKLISQALFANRDLGNPALTTADSVARVVELRPRAIVYEAERGDVALAAGSDLVAFAIDFDVLVRTQ
jgi:hypothetical protein